MYTMPPLLDRSDLPPSLFLLNTTLTIAHFNLFCVPEMAMINTSELARYLWNCELISNTTAERTAVEFDELGEVTVQQHIGKKRSRPKTNGNATANEMEESGAIIRLRMPTLYTSARSDDLADCSDSVVNGKSSDNNFPLTSDVEAGKSEKEPISLEHSNVSCTVASSGNVTVYSKHPNAMYALCNYIRRYLCTAILEHCPWCVTISAAISSSSVLTALKGRLPKRLRDRVANALAVPTSLEEILTCRDGRSWDQYAVSYRRSNDTATSAVGESGVGTLDLLRDMSDSEGHYPYQQGSVNLVLVRLSRVRAALGWYKDRYYPFEQINRPDGVEIGGSVPLHQFGFRISNITGYIYPTQVALDQHHSNLLRTTSTGYKTSAPTDTAIHRIPAVPTNLGMTIDEFSILKTRLEENAVREAVVIAKDITATPGRGIEDEYNLKEGNAVKNDENKNVPVSILNDFDDNAIHNLYSVALASCFAGVGDIGSSILADLEATRSNDLSDNKTDELEASSKLIPHPPFKDVLIRMLMRSRVFLTTNKNDTKLRFEVLCEGRTTEITVTRRSGVIRLIMATSMEDVRILLLRGILPAAFGLEPILE